MNLFARFDEIFKILRKQNVTDRRTDGWTHTRGQGENSIPTTNKVCGGYNDNTNNHWYIQFNHSSSLHYRYTLQTLSIMS